jgi:hypothetical protein
MRQVKWYSKCVFFICVTSFREDNTLLNRSRAQEILKLYIKAVKDVILAQCVSVRGSTSNLAGDGKATASVLKRQKIYSKPSSGLLPQGIFDDAGLALVLTHNPREIQERWHTMDTYTRRIREEFNIFKYCRGDHDRMCYYVMAAGAVAPPVVGERDRSGMGRATATAFNIPCGSKSVLRRQQIIRDAWDKMKTKVRPLEVGEGVVCAMGAGRRYVVVKSTQWRAPCFDIVSSSSSATLESQETRSTTGLL